MTSGTWMFSGMKTYVAMNYRWTRMGAVIGQIPPVAVEKDGAYRVSFIVVATFFAFPVLWIRIAVPGNFPDTHSDR